jgi:hypothetical protein
MVTINGILLAILLLALLFALTARARLWYYRRRCRRQTREVRALIAERDGLRAECEAIFWGDQL